jgi:hypothetical protein
MSGGGNIANSQSGFLPTSNAGIDIGTAPIIGSQASNNQILESQLSGSGQISSAGQLGSNQNISGQLSSVGQLGSNHNISAVNTSIANSLVAPQSAPPINYLSGYFPAVPQSQMGAHRTNSLLNESYYGSLGNAPFAQQFHSNLYLNQVSICNACQSNLTWNHF